MLQSTIKQAPLGHPSNTAFHKTTNNVIFLSPSTSQGGCLQSCTTTKQDGGVINCTLLAMLKKIKGKKVQSSDRGWMEGCYQLRKDSRREEVEEDSAKVSTDSNQRLSAPTISRDAATGSCSQTHKPLMRQQLQDSSCYCALVCLGVRLCTHACVTLVFSLCALNQSFTQSSALSVQHSRCKGMAIAPHPAVISTGSQSVRHSVRQ